MVKNVKVVGIRLKKSKVALFIDPESVYFSKRTRFWLNNPGSPLYLISTESLLVEFKKFKSILLGITIPVLRNS